MGEGWAVLRERPAIRFWHSAREFLADTGPEPSALKGGVMKRAFKDRLRDRRWDLLAHIGCKLGLYTKCADYSGRYYYVCGPLLPRAHFAVIGEHLEHKQDQWTTDWMTGKPTAVLWFSCWKLHLRNYSPATFAEADWYRGFVEVDRLRRRR